MFPVLFSAGNITISSFGVFLALGFLFGVFLVWRLARAWDFSEEKILDLTLLTFLGGLTFARVYFILEHLEVFGADPIKWFHILKFPGFSFWGGFLGGWLSLYFSIRRFKMDFAAVADIASVGFLGGLIFGSLGCFLGGCDIGIKSSLFFSVPMTGAIGKRLPVQAIEAMLLSFALFKIWSQATHFHLRGKILSLSLIYIGTIKLLMESLKQGPSSEYLFSSTLILLGVVIFYKIQGGKRTPISDLGKFKALLVGLTLDQRIRNRLMHELSRIWYNQKTSFNWKLRNLAKLLRRLRVKPTP